MADWENLPVELLLHLYSYLPRRDRISCSLACKKWKNGLDQQALWKTMVVHIDTDLMEPSTIFLLRDYGNYLKNLEFGWAVVHRNVRWAPNKFKELTKRAVRFFLVLYDSCVQITSFRIFNWFDFMSFHKLTYHICRFLKNQMNLEAIIFDNLSMQSTNYIKILTACLSSKTTITSLDIRGCYYCHATFNSIYFRSCVEQLSYLNTLKLDYFVLSCKLIDAILTSKNSFLENMEIIIKETSWRDQVIDDLQWVLLVSACPNLKVTLVIRNVYHYGELMQYLKESIPVVSLSVLLPENGEGWTHCNFRKTLNLLVRNYHRTLETVDLNINNEQEDLDFIILIMLRKCSKLLSFFYNGFLDNPQRIKSSYTDVKCYCIVTECSEGVVVFKQVLIEEVAEMRHKRVQLTLMKQNPKSACTLLFLN